MEDLHELDVKLGFTTRWARLEQQMVVFEPMKAVTRPDLFGLRQETPVEIKVKDLGLPCKI